MPCPKPAQGVRGMQVGRTVSAVGGGGAAACSQRAGGMHVQHVMAGAGGASACRGMLVTCRWDIFDAVGRQVGRSSPMDSAFADPI